MGIIRREIDYAIHLGENVPEYVTETIISTPEKLDKALAENTQKVIDRYKIDPDDIEVKDVRVCNLWKDGKQYTRLSDR